MSELIRVICQIDACCSAVLNTQDALSLVLIFQVRLGAALNEKDEKAPWLLAPAGTTDHGRLVAQSQAFSMTVVSSDVEVQHSAA